MDETKPLSPPAAPRAPLRSTAAYLLAGALAALAIAAWYRLSSLELFGWDAYPLIATSQVHGLGDLARVASQELMAGRYPLGDYYRPLVHLSFALDGALWGIEPFGYHLTDLLLWVASALATFALALRLFGRDALAAAAVAGAFVALHPLAYDVLPAPARRADELAMLFTLLALTAAPRPGESRAGLRAVLAGVAAFLAVASKESGAVAALAVLALAFGDGHAQRTGARVRNALRVAAPALIGLALFLVLRTAVLGGLGGHARVGFAGAFTNIPMVIARSAQALFPPLQDDASARLSDFVSASAMMALVGLSVGCSFRARTGPLGARRPLTLLLVWAALLVLVTGFAGDKRVWYALPFLPIAALALGYVAHHGVELARSGPVLGGAVLFGFAVLVVGWCGRNAALLRPLPEPIADGDARIRAFFTRMDVGLLGARLGGTMTVEALRPELAFQEHGREARLALHTDYSIQAYLDLHYPGTKFRVERGGSKPPAPAAPDEFVVVLQPPPQSGGH